MEEFLMKASAAGDIEATFELGKFHLEQGKVEEGENLIEESLKARGKFFVAIQKVISRHNLYLINF